MATRLQADEANQAGKWADIDEDEDDWAPETVQWMDGTKSTVLAEKAAPTPTKPQLKLLPRSESATESKPAPPAQPPTSLPSAGKTILKPGLRNSVQTRPGLALRSVPEAPSQTVKPAPTTSSSSNKSPWAPIPIIDKASPVVFEPPQRPMINRYDSSAIDDLPTPSPAKEIAADDFDRSWRDGDRGSQALFNSQSGRYEPVRGTRRASRNEGGFRPPSVLQRPVTGQYGGRFTPMVVRGNHNGLGGAIRHMIHRLQQSSRRLPSSLPATPVPLFQVLQISMCSRRLKLVISQHHKGQWKRSVSSSTVSCERGSRAIAGVSLKNRPKKKLKSRKESDSDWQHSGHPLRRLGI